MSDKDLQDFEKFLQGICPAPLEKTEEEEALLQCYAGELAAIALSDLSPQFLDELERKAIAGELSSFQPSSLHPELLETLCLAPVEAELKELTLPSLSPSFLDQLVHLTENIEQTETHEKVIPFPVQKKPSSWKWYTTAAAVAVLGLITGFKMIPPGKAPSSIALSTTDHAAHAASHFDAQPISGEILNVSTNSTFINAQDEGLIPNKSKTSYYRAMNVVSMETVILENEFGEKIEVKRPVQRTVLIPAETD